MQTLCLNLFFQKSFIFVVVVVVLSKNESGTYTLTHSKYDPKTNILGQPVD